MKTIEGKRYYVSIGYVDEEQIKLDEPIDVKDIHSIFITNKKDKGTPIYYDNSDKDNIIAIPLTPVNEIRREGDSYVFRVIIDPFKMEYVDLDLQGKSYFEVNAVGLFAVYTKDDEEVIEKISFYHNKHCILTRADSARTFSIEASVNKIMGDN